MGDGAEVSDVGILVAKGEMFEEVGKELVEIKMGIAVNGEAIGRFDCGMIVGNMVVLDEGFCTVGSVENEGEGFREGIDDDVLVGLVDLEGVSEKEDGLTTEDGTAVALKVADGDTMTGVIVDCGISVVTLVVFKEGFNTVGKEVNEVEGVVEGIDDEVLVG